MSDVFYDCQVCGWFRMGWLQVYYIFLFGFFNDLMCMGFCVLCVINEDVIVGGLGFVEYVYDYFEILIFMLLGELEYKDLVGYYGWLQVGDVQFISFGIGVWYLEWNLVVEMLMYFFQIWLYGMVDELLLCYQVLLGVFVIVGL